MADSNFDSIKLDKTTKLASPDTVAASGSAPTKAEFDAVVTLVNEIKAKLNTIFQA